MSLRLVVVTGRTIGTQLRLSQQTMVEIGSSPSADLTLHDPAIALLHLKLYRDEQGQLTCFDVTGQGFGHNNTRVLKANLQIGDLIQVGSHVVRLIADRPDLVPRADPLLTAPGQANGEASLRAVRGNDAGKSFPLGEKPTVIMGRGAETDITIWDIRASRAHARIDRQGNAYRLSDLGSSNGTYVNGKKITSHQLRAGDMIKIGASVLQFSLTG